MSNQKRRLVSFKRQFRRSQFDLLRENNQLKDKLDQQFVPIFPNGQQDVKIQKFKMQLIGCEDYSQFHSKIQAFIQEEMPSDQEISQRQTRPTLQPEIVNSSEVQIKVNYVENRINLDYENEGQPVRIIKYLLLQFIEKRLKNQKICAKQNCRETAIFDQTKRIYNDSGYYRFDPFQDSVQILICSANQNPLKRNFKVDGTPSINFFSVTDLTKKSMINALVPTNHISQLIKCVGLARNLKRDELIQIQNSFVQKGGVHIIQDLFKWTKEDYNKQQLKTAVAYQFMDSIAQMKSNTVNADNHNQEQKGFLKVATSHKVLRYLIYQNQGEHCLKQIPFLNRSNLQNVIKYSKKRIFNDFLLDKLLQFYKQYTFCNIKYQRGLILHGPPGTGKTKLTQMIPELAGFHLISKGVSAADFSKSLVGQTFIMIQELTSRAKFSEHLICSIGIDQVDGLVPDRKNKEQKNKDQGISKLLSDIDGITDKKNLIFLTSTNYLKRIDQAIARRLCGHYLVGRPNPQQRKCIIRNQFNEATFNSQSKLSLIISLTVNFTGAALVRLSNDLKLQLQDKRNGQSQIYLNDLSRDKIYMICHIVAEKFKIGFGMKTVPQLMQEQISYDQILTIQFLNKVQTGIAVIQSTQIQAGSTYRYNILFANQIKLYREGSLKTFNETQKETFELKICGDKFETFKNLIEKNQELNNFQIKILGNKKYATDQGYSQDIDIFIEDWKKNSRKSPQTFLVIKVSRYIFKKFSLNKKIAKLDLRKKLFVIIYLQDSCADEIVRSEFPDWSSPGTPQYSGRIAVDFNKEIKMAFQLKSSGKESKVAFRHFMKGTGHSNTDRIIPQILQFFLKRQVNFVVKLDFKTILNNDAFEQRKAIEAIQQKLNQARGYAKSALIIDADSLVNYPRSTSISEHGTTQSYSIQNFQMYKLLLSYLNNFSIVNSEKEHWVCVICQHPELAKLIKSDIYWPIQPQQQKAKKQEEQDRKQKRCLRCFSTYTQAQNKKQNKCMQHPFKLFDLRRRQFIYTDLRSFKLFHRMDNQDQMKRYVFLCCMGDMHSQGESAYPHISQNQQIDTHQLQIQTSEERLPTLRMVLPD